MLTQLQNAQARGNTVTVLGLLPSLVIRRKESNGPMPANAYEKSRADAFGVDPVGILPMGARN